VGIAHEFLFGRADIGSSQSRRPRHDLLPGEIICRGENITIGYWRKPTATAEALRDGWFHTGDIATIDEDGYYRIVDRKKDMINAGGFKVWPREVEEVLFRHPAVREAAVVAIPDVYWGERPIAYIVLKEGRSATGEALIAYCQDHLAPFKAPCLINFRLMSYQSYRPARCCAASSGTRPDDVAKIPR
jgi:long-chain acyl-CoA synthetase